MSHDRGTTKITSSEGRIVVDQAHDLESPGAMLVDDVNEMLGAAAGSHDKQMLVIKAAAPDSPEGQDHADLLGVDKRGGDGEYEADEGAADVRLLGDENDTAEDDER